MKRGKEIRTANGHQMGTDAAHEIMALMFVMIERAPGAFSLRCVSNDEVLQALEQQGTLQTFLEDVDQLYTDFRKRFRKAEERPN